MYISAPSWHKLLCCQMWCVRPLHKLTLCCWWMAPGVLDVLTSRQFGPSSAAWWGSLTLVLIGSKSVRLTRTSNMKVVLLLLIQQKKSLSWSNKEFAVYPGLAQYSGDPKTEWYLNEHPTRDSLLNAVANLPYKGGNTMTGTLYLSDSSLFR